MGLEHHRKARCVLQKVDNNEEACPKHLDWSLPNSSRLFAAREHLWPLREADHHALCIDGLCGGEKTDPTPHYNYRSKRSDSRLHTTYLIQQLGVQSSHQTSLPVSQLTWRWDWNLLQMLPLLVADHTIFHQWSTKHYHLLLCSRQMLMHWSIWRTHSLASGNSQFTWGWGRNFT